VRLAAFFAALFLVAGVAFVMVLWLATAGALDRQADAAIRADAAALVERFRDGGAAAVAEAIGDRMAEDVEQEALYFLADAAGTRLAGNLDGPGVSAGDGAWQGGPLLRDGERAEARVLRRDLPDGGTLLVGRDVQDRQALRALLAEGLASSAAVALLLALLGAWLVRRALEARLGPAVETAAAIAQGDLSRRVPLSSSRDEFDGLGLTMNAMLDRIGQLMDGVRGVSDAIAHDLRTPIARARNNLDEALASARDEAVLRAALERGIVDLDNISRIFQAVLRIAELEAGARRAAFAPLDLAPLLEDAAEIYAASAEVREQTLEVSVSGPLPLVGDRDLLFQAMANLLDNAVKFAPPGGRVRLRSSLLPAQAGGPRLLRVSVSDSGPGLDPAERARAGERFFRADGARTTPGSGLGLSLVRAVAALHGGELRLADARPGEVPPGLEATLLLPVEAPSPPV